MFYVAMGDDNTDHNSEINKHRRWLLKTSALGTVAGGSLIGSTGNVAGSSHNESASDCLLNHFREYSIHPPERYADLRDDAAETAQEAETNRMLSEANITAIHALETIANVHYGNYVGGAGDFLKLMDQSTQILVEESGHPLYDSLRKYTQSAKFVYDLLHDPDNPMEEYVELVEEAHGITQDQDADSIQAALELALRGYSGTLRDDITQMAVETAELPLHSTVTGLEINSQQQLILKTFTESQQPILDELARLTERRDEETITEQEMYGHFACRQEFELAMLQFSNHIYHLQQLGEEESIFFRISTEISEFLGNDVLEEAQQSRERSRDAYNKRLEDLAEFREAISTC